MEENKNKNDKKKICMFEKAFSFFKTNTVTSIKMSIANSLLFLFLLLFIFFSLAFSSRAQNVLKLKKNLTFICCSNLQQQ